jgi:anti-sigma regulatory factor (Ser/Thr protein kinase)
MTETEPGAIRASNARMHAPAYTRPPDARVVMATRAPTRCPRGRLKERRRRVAPAPASRNSDAGRPRPGSPFPAEHAFRRSFAPDVSAPAAARQALERLGGYVDDDLVERGRLVVTELVTNSVRHGRLTPAQQIDLRVSARRDLLRLEVIDDGRGFDPAATRPDPAGSGGSRGLRIVAQLTDRWELDLGQSTRVWCELIAQADREPSSA